MFKHFKKEERRYTGIKYVDACVNTFSKQFKHKKKDIIIEALKNDILCINVLSSWEQLDEYEKVSSPFPSSRKKEIEKRHFWNGIYITSGIHPHHADTYLSKTSRLKWDVSHYVEHLAGKSNTVAIGECGLDYDRMYSSKDAQIYCFKQQISLAEEYNKPLFLHERNASEDFLNILNDHKEIASKSLVHCFTSDIKTLDKYLNLGLSVSISTFICDDNRAKDLREAVKIVPLDKLLVETDSPYLRPKLYNLKGVNIPQNVKFAVEYLAKYMEKDEKEIRINSVKNALNLFGLEKLFGEIII